MTEIRSVAMEHSVCKRQYSGRKLSYLAHAKWALLVSALLICSVVAASLACATGPTETRENSFAVGESPALVVKVLNGRIETTAASDNVIQVKAVIRDAPAVKYEAIQEGDTIRITAERTGQAWLHGQAGVDIFVTAPANVELTLETSNGSIKIVGAQNGGSLKTSNGEIVLENVRGSFEGSTSNGSVTLNGAEGRVYIRTSNGKVNVRDAKGEFDIASSNGAISFAGDMNPGGQNRLVTSNGSVQVELAGTPSIKLDASTSNGDVTSLLPILATKTESNHLVGTIGSGEADLYIKSSNGNVTVK
jgi:hypothetical protein